MSAVEDNDHALAAAMTHPAVFGEPVELVGGRTILGVFTSPGDAAMGVMGSEAGLRSRVTAQTNPVLGLRDADAALVPDGEPLAVRGAFYRVVARFGDGLGMTELLLAPAARTLGDPLARYR